MDKRVHNNFCPLLSEKITNNNHDLKGKEAIALKMKSF